MMSLTDEQKAIVTLGYQHCVITAVAGSGKTTTLAWRIRHLLEQGHDPERMLILMFNRSARADFQRKLQELCQGTRLRLPEIRTYHAMGLRLYRRFIKEGYLPAFQGEVLTEQEVNFQAWLLTQQLAPEDLQDEVRRNKKEFVETATAFIDRVKTTLKPPETVFEALGFENRHRYLLDVFHAFEQWRRDHRRITFADMLHEPVVAIHNNPPLQQLVGNKMDLILVDEYQDTNEIQHLLLKYVAGERARVTVVGDPDQTIYEFRGARPDFILSRFREEFPEPVSLNLSYTFRYGHRVALLANHLIAHNQDRKDVLCHSHPDTPDTDVHLTAVREDADYIIRMAQERMEAGEPLNDVAVLVRVWSQSVPIELKLLARQIPYRIDAHKGALFTREMDSLMHLLALAAGEHRQPGNETAFRERRQLFQQLMRFPHCGLKEPELNAMTDWLAGFSCDWGKVLQSMDTSNLKPLPARKLRKLGEALEAAESSQMPAHRIIEDYANTTELFEGIRSLALTHETADERIGTVTGFQRYLSTLDLDAATALKHLRELKARAGSGEQNGVHLSTIHRTKGLEWPVVIIPGLQEKVFPYTARGDENLASLLESERRLLYVGMTRAINSLHLLTCSDTEGDDRLPSRFVAEFHFGLSNELGGTLHGRDSGGRITLSEPASTIAHRYAKLHDTDLDCPAPPEPDANNASPVWHAREVEHVLFGAGSILREDDTSFEVRFHSGRVLNFSKKSAHLYFSALSH
ncbi:DNA helicase-2/ATP-dependent DNA helicase PcrA [Halospina denitrificans]|uniref:DNA 3'-5' helicase n=1 Tax=Halospina denitrificans TaxID=332522 RepID=A0A4V3ER94_9GAMM|nr:ATP-dependent helicase [Halospina denitrificans]TDT43928.1 DNA helicase-2/ATP-dependent DNA helicase PcrA [Halospina denitrificans]